jgi:TetR/AcrR family transcriptional repressor of nem operon
MLVFWQMGYSATSISDLEEATGLKRQSLYNAFGDKQELYKKTLQRYLERNQEALVPLQSARAGVKELKQLILQNLGVQAEHDCRACMVVKTAFDQQVDDPAIREAVRHSGMATRKLFAKVLSQAQERGEIGTHADPKQLAAYLFSVMNGLSALAQTGASRREVERALEFAFQGLNASTANQPA